jgi:hypothetical protein
MCLSQSAHLAQIGAKLRFLVSLQAITAGSCGSCRTVPLAWTRVQGARGHNPAVTQLALLRYVQQLLPAGAEVLLIGDTGFGAVAIMQQVHTWRWHYVLRLV